MPGKTHNRGLNAKKTRSSVHEKARHRLRSDTKQKEHYKNTDHHGIEIDPKRIIIGSQLEGTTRERKAFGYRGPRDERGRPASIEYEKGIENQDKQDEPLTVEVIKEHEIITHLQNRGERLLKKESSKLEKNKNPL